MNELWTVALFFRPHGRRQNLIFRDEARARATFLAINPHVPSATDDYGCETIVLAEGPLEMVMLVEEERAAEAAVELALVQARTQAKANRAAQSDPQLKFLSGAMPGMSFPR